MNYKDKQEWIEAVMASDLGAATKVYAYGVFQHMYGLKDESFPSGKAIAKATGLATGKFYLHNQALEDAGFLEVTHRRGRSNEYRLIEPTHRSGRSLEAEETDLPTEEVGTYPQKGEGLPTEGVTPTHRRGTNTTKNTSSKTTSKKTEEKQEVAVPADAVPTTSLNYEVPDTLEEIEWEIEPLLNSQTTEAASKSDTTRDLPTEGVTQDNTTHGDEMSDLMLLNEGERDALIRKGSIYGATKEQIREAAALLNCNTIAGGTWGDKCEAALIKVGVEGLDEW